MGKKKKPGKDLLSEFLRKAGEQGKTYAQAQMEETCELIRKGRLGQKRR